MPRLVLDIETAGAEFDTLDPATQKYFLRRAKTDAEVREVKDTTAFYPMVSEVVAIGLLDADTGKGAMYYQAPFITGTTTDNSQPDDFEEDGVRYEASDEAGILGKFWAAVKSAQSIITFNGRGFDCPFLYTRSAYHKVEPTRDLMPNRYSDAHIDLMDRLSYFGAQRRNFSLDMWCRFFGITSPKQEVSGEQVTDLFRQGHHLDIARYCVRDIHATAKLYHRWLRYMTPPSRH